MKHRLQLVIVCCLSSFLVSAQDISERIVPLDNTTTCLTLDENKQDLIQGFSEEACEWKAIKLYGKVQFVTSFPDIKIQYVTSFPDLKVQFVEAFPNSCGKWQEVNSFPDIKVQVVTSFPDLKVQKVTSFPGMH